MSEILDERRLADLGTPIPQSFYARSSVIVAPELLNCILVSTSEEGTTAGRIAETEAYTQDDAASHAFRGRTARNEVMFGAAGHAYVYFTYGMHYCLNTVTGLEGQGEAVLIRAIEPLYGTELMLFRRGLFDGRESIDSRIQLGRLLGGGPARLCQSLGVTAGHNGVDLTITGRLSICPPIAVAELSSNNIQAILSTSRIGITKAVDLPRRFTIAADLFTSRPSK